MCVCVPVRVQYFSISEGEHFVIILAIFLRGLCLYLLILLSIESFLQETPQASGERYAALLLDVGPAAVSHLNDHQ